MADIKIQNPKVVGKLKLPAESASKALQISASGEVESSTVTTTELGHLSGVTSSVQTQLSAAATTIDAVTTALLYVAKNGSDTNSGSILKPFLTIGAAITAASSGTTVNITPGTYTENITLKSGVSLQGQQARSVVINGNMTAAFIGTVYLHSLDLQSSSGDVLTFSGSNATNLQIDDTHIDSLSGGGHCINHTNTNSVSKISCDNGAFNVTVSTSAKVFNSSASSAGSIIWEDVSARILDNLDHVVIAVAGALTFSHLFDDVHGQVTVANSASYNGVDLTMQTSSVAILVTNSSSVSILANIICATTAIPAVSGAGLFAYGSIGYSSTGDGLAATLNAGAGASPIPVSSIQFHPAALTTLPYDGQLSYTGTHLYTTIGSTRYQLDQQSTGTNTGDQTATTVPNTPAGNIAATNVQAAINELDSEKIATSEKGAVNGVATLDSNSLIPITQIPPAALERLVIVANQTARFALTLATVQNGDTVKQTDTGVMYFVKDDTDLGTAGGYAEYVAGTAAAVAWSGISGIPAPVSSLSGTNTGDQDLSGYVLNTRTVNGHALSADVTVTKSDVSLGNVDDVQQLPMSYLDTDNTLAANSDVKVASQKAIKAYVTTAVGASSHTGDIAHTSFAAANNIVAAASVTGLAFAAGSVRSFKVQISVSIDATTDLNEIFDLQGIQLAGGFVMASSSVGDDSGVVFTVTSAGQVQYTSANSAGFVSNSMKFRATVTDV